jgi:hypothetical protein
MTKHQREAQTVWRPSTPLATMGPTGSVEHSLSNKKPMVLKCSCPGTEVPFYCPLHGRVENPNRPLLSGWSDPHTVRGDAKS